MSQQTSTATPTYSNAETVVTLNIDGQLYTFKAAALKQLEQIVMRLARVTLNGDDIHVKLFEPTTGTRQIYTFKPGDTVKCRVRAKQE